MQVKSPGEENDNPLQCCCLENPMDKGAWQATVYGVARVGHNLANKYTPAHPVSGPSNSSVRTEQLSLKLRI